MTCSGKENEAVRATKNEGGGGVRATTCGERAADCSLSVCGQPLAHMQRATPHRKPVGEFYLPKTGAGGGVYIRDYRTYMFVAQGTNCS